MTEPTEDHAEDEATVEDVSCTVCGCVCDDLRVRVAGGRLVRVENACGLAEPWFADLQRARGERPAAAIAGRAVSLKEGIGRAAEILRGSRAPLIWGLSRSSTAGQRAAVRLGEALGATVDTTASVCHGPSIMAVQCVGESTSTLGEVRNRSDLVVFWGANPAVSHPRHFERYSADARGQFVPRGRADRTVVVVDSERHATAERADVFVRVEPGRDFEAIWALRQLVRGEEPARTDGLGAPVEELRSLAKRMAGCRYGAVFFGLGLAGTPLGHANVEALLRLVTDLNARTRFTARRLRIPGDVTGADSVLCWQTGYPFAVNLGREYPRYNPDEFTAEALLSRGEADACVLVGSEAVPLLSEAARARLGAIPVIALDYEHQEPAVEATVRFTTAVYGVHEAGTAYRMDEVPIGTRAFLGTAYPTDGTVLEGMRAEVAGR